MSPRHMNTADHPIELETIAQLDPDPDQPDAEPTEHLAGGRMLEPGEIADDVVMTPHNQQLVDDGHLTQVVEPKSKGGAQQAGNGQEVNQP